MGLTGRIRLTGSKPVLEAAEHLIAELLASYARPAVDRRTISAFSGDLVRLLVVFTEACRSERETALRLLW